MHNLVDDALLGHLKILCTQGGLEVEDRIMNPGTLCEPGCTCGRQRRQLIVRDKAKTNAVELWRTGEALLSVSWFCGGGDFDLNTDCLTIPFDDPKLIDKVVGKVNEVFGTTIVDV